MDRKQELRRLLANVAASSPVKYVDHVDAAGVALFERVCNLDLEGIVAKHKYAPYVSDRERSTWFKIATRHIRRWWAARNCSSVSEAVNLLPDGTRAN